MGFLRKQESLGIDIGMASAKAVVIRMENKCPVLVGADTLDTGAEGILNEAELFASVAGWLRDAPWAVGTPTVGLPQYLGTTQITDFPPGVKDGLEDMVRYETQQLAGLSDESFVHDFQVLPPGHGRRNPVLIGLCRESVVQERLQALGDAGLHPTSLGMNGLAALNALHYLQPQLAADDSDPHVLLDIGQDSTTIIVFVGIRPLYTGTVDFGSRMITDTILDRVGGDERKAEERKRELDVQDVAPSSRVRDLMKRLDGEIQNALEHWREQQPGPLAEAPLQALWISGGGARQRGLAEYLEDRYECPVRRFGPPDPATPGEVMPEYVTALGLALLGAEAGTVRISLMPTDVKWALKRVRRMPWLIAAIAATACALVTLVAASYLQAKHTLDRQSDWADELSACDRHIARIRKMQAGIRSHEASVVPLVEIGNRGPRVLQCLDDLAKVKEDGMWFVYLGDELSYEAGKLDKQKKHPTAPPRRVGMGGAFQGTTDLPDEFPKRLSPLQVPQLKALIVAAYAPFVITEPYGAQTRLKAKLAALGSYPGLDSLPGLQQQLRQDIFRPWNTFLARNPQVRYSSFMLRLPLASLPVDLPEPEPKEGKR
jgi:type IV pilus assembly protein PilM